ncbi:MULTISPECIES: ATP-dependent helicase HrpB [Lonsdalea]|uniref:ATP-dependent helicase n=2 Tax=Lonsdalea TaxID=1082702 RepID=A0ACD1J9M0_9GAMM|nr:MULTISPECIES: ATP-dependent helicase HrpB [Lonsdalea]RAT11271.1 ATP-dependent helicase [Lonsdalea quercina]RAT21245.1 ATP-dependent helicase [Lonsdalea populi]RAT25189.1 ATP-dependent helicase [Lonsdalea populi]RAT28282.1 ATP-dependent helicase [Lonsdalea populi]RAT35320.1 ATP-dependent helicase [Lonsdalea populi]
MSLPPVSEVLEDVIHALRHAPQVLLHAPTGAGKSTWLPLQLLQNAALSGRIILLEPRRLAAKSVAFRLAELLGETPGQTVGYRMRAETCCSAQTRLEVVTEGILTRMLQQDAGLEGVSLVILDEFHERSLQADLALALLLDVQAGLRDDLKLLIMSATLDNDRLSSLLPDARTVSSQGRAYPVTRRFQAPGVHERLEDSLARLIAHVLQQESGSMLVFLPGVAEIKRLQRLLSERIAADTDLCPLYGALALSAQQQAIRPAAAGRRKVVLATNIAETSLTIEGIRVVVDSGLVRVALFDVKSGLTRLTTQRISQASMTQRAGRAGRLEPGVCWHLCTKEQAERTAAQSEAEILHSDLSGLWLDLLQWGCRDVGQLTWLDIPPAPILSAAQRLLLQLGIVDDRQQLTTTGRQTAGIGSDPRLAVMLHAAARQGGDALATAALLAAVIEEPPRSGSPNLFDSLRRPASHWQCRATQLARRLGGAKGRFDDGLAVGLLAQGFADRIARRRGQDGRYQLANGVGAQLAEDDPLTSSEWLIVPALMQSPQSADARIQLALPVDIDRLLHHSPGLLSERNIVHWDEEKGTLRASRRSQIGCLTLRTQPLAKPSDDDLQQAMLNWLREQGLSVLNWDPAALQLRARIQCARQWLPDAEWPEVDDDALLITLEQWLLPSLTGVRDRRGLNQLNLEEALQRCLGWRQKQRLDSALPSHYTVPGGSRLPIRYAEEAPPALAVRLQEMFGERESPRIAEGRVALVLELLSPAQRPLQITRDLAAFWQGAYRDVQKEMKGRYPKHVWPDDPANAAPTRRTRKYQNQ